MSSEFQVGLEYALIRSLKGMVVTVEPGVYFNDYCLETALKDENQSKYINESVLARFRGIGGVRIEDNVIVTKNGIINMTQCPRDIADVEATMKGKRWEVKTVDSRIDSEPLVSSFYLDFINTNLISKQYPLKGRFLR